MKNTIRFFVSISVILFCFCFDDSDDFGPNSYGTGLINVKAYVKHDNLFPFICDSAVVAVTAPDMIPFYQNIPVSGDSAIGQVSGISAGNDREITVTVFDPTRLKWCGGKDTCNIIDSRTAYITINLKQEQPNIISNDTIHGHRLTADELWAGNCFLRGDIYIPENIKLTVETGSTIRIATSQFDWDSGGQTQNKVDIYCRGQFIANGNSNSIISFIPDCTLPAINCWWGIGISNGFLSMSYCHISSGSYGVFIFSGNKSAPDIENCCISYVNVGIADFGPDNSYSRLTFNNTNYAFFIYGKNKNVDISQCVFSENSMVDVQAIDSNQNITVRNSNFYSKDFNNLYISKSSTGPKNTVITAVGCYNINQVNDNESGTIFLSHQASAPVPDAGCGFSVQLPDILPVYKRTYLDLEKQVRIVREEWERAIGSCN